MRGGSKPSMRRTADQMPLNIECVVDRRMNRNEPLTGFGPFEALHLSFSSSNRLMRVLRTVVGPRSLLMPSGETNFATRRTVRSQVIGDDNRGDKALAAKELAQKAHCHGLVASGLNKNFQNLALAVNGTPHVHLLSRERDHHFIQMPAGVSLRPGRPQILSDHRAEFEHPPADCLVADNEAALCQEVLNVAVAQSEPEIEPDGMADDVRWKSMARIGNWLHGSL